MTHTFLHTVVEMVKGIGAPDEHVHAVDEQRANVLRQITLKGQKLFALAAVAPDLCQFKMAFGRIVQLPHQRMGGGTNLSATGDECFVLDGAERTAQINARNGRAWRGFEENLGIILSEISP